jgi:hypothetical protein
VSAAVECVQPGEKGSQRWRQDKRVKRYLCAKRPDPADVQRLISYRTEACVAANTCADADTDVRELIISEYEWALRELALRDPATLRSLGYPRRYWRHIENEQLGLFEGGAR